VNYGRFIRARTAILLTLVIAVAAAAAVAVPAVSRKSAPTRLRRIPVRIALPSTARVDTLTVKVTVKRGAAPRSLGFKVANVRQLPADIRVAAGDERPVRRGRTTTFTLVVVTNNLASLSGRAAQASELQGEIDLQAVAAKSVFSMTVTAAALAPEGSTLSEQNCTELKAAIRNVVAYHRLQNDVQSPPDAIFAHTYARLCPSPPNQPLTP
jgi:hypothetical protein